MDPSNVTASDGPGRAFLDAATVDQKKDWEIRIEVIHHIEDRFHIHLDVELLFQFPPQGLPRVLAFFHLSSRKFPEETSRRCLHPLGYEDCIFFSDQACRDDECPHLRPLPGCGPLSSPGRGPYPPSGSIR